MNEQ
jgi:hypothetical protein